MNCLQKILKGLKNHPHKVALTGFNGLSKISSFTYKQLAQEIFNFKNKLLTQGVKQRDCIPILASAHPESLIAILAVMSLKAIAVPVNPLSTKIELEQIKAIKIPETGIKSPILLMHSSGSSGIPKQIIYDDIQLERFMLRHDYLYRQYSDKADRQVYKSDLICALPVFHLAGLAICLQALIMGRTLYFQQNFILEDYLKLAVQKKIQLLLFIPSMLERLAELAQQDFAEYSHNCIKYCITGGEPISNSLVVSIEKNLNAKVFIVCGLSECQTGIGHSQKVIDNIVGPKGNCGQQLFGEVKLVEEDGITENNYIGELWVRNDTVYPCYLDQKMNEKRIEGGWFKTGDIVKRNQQGYFFFCGRKDNMFVVNGKNIYPEEIENILQKHSAVAKVLSFPLVSCVGKTFPGVMIKLHSTKPHPPSESDLINYYLIYGHLHSTPGWVYLVDKMPLLPQGKIDRLECELLLQANYEIHYKSTA